MDLDKLLGFLDKVQGWPGPVLVFASCIVVGYVWKAIPHKVFSNDAIPAVVVIWGMFFTCFLAGDPPAGMHERSFIVRNAMSGMVIGFAAWLAHWMIISKLEAMAGKPLSQIGNTNPQSNQPSPSTNDPKVS